MPNVEDYILREGQFFVDRSTSEETDVLYCGDGETPLKDLKPVGGVLMSLPPMDGQVYSMVNKTWVPQAMLGDEEAVTYPAIPEPKHFAARGVRQMDLYLPDTFAAAVSNAALATYNDYAMWDMEPAYLKHFRTRYTGSAGIQAQLVVNGVKVGPVLTVPNNAWGYHTVDDEIKIQTGDELEIAILTTVADAKGLRFTIVAEVK